MPQEADESWYWTSRDRSFSLAPLSLDHILGYCSYIFKKQILVKLTANRIKNKSFSYIPPFQYLFKISRREMKMLYIEQKAC